MKAQKVIDELQRVFNTKKDIDKGFFFINYEDLLKLMELGYENIPDNLRQNFQVFWNPEKYTDDEVKENVKRFIDG